MWCWGYLVGLVAISEELLFKAVPVLLTKDIR